ncbi:hypothetical protein PMCN06_1726 [Pasteurella multocida subsp. multocida str. HN06]|nr:hypothetical protein PMCN06_1726 [Pasteurella multocida subsp. multocida str. HN06]
MIGIDDITLSNTKAVNLSKYKTFLKIDRTFLIFRLARVVG